MLKVAALRISLKEGTSCLLGRVAVLLCLCSTSFESPVAHWEVHLRLGLELLLLFFLLSAFLDDSRTADEEFSLVWSVLG